MNLLHYNIGLLSLNYVEEQRMISNPLVSGNIVDPEEMSFHFWLSESKEWVKRYGINAVIEMMMQENYEVQKYDVS